MRGSRDYAVRRRALLEAAYNVMMEQGLANTTMRAVAARAGQTTGALVYYFRSKDELIGEVLDEHRRNLRARMTAAARGRNSRTALRDMLLVALPTDERSARGWRNWLGLWYQSETDDVVRAELHRLYKEWIGRITRALRRCVAEGTLQKTLNVNQEARNLVALVDGLGVQYLVRRGSVPHSQTVAQLDLYLDRLFRSSSH